MMCLFVCCGSLMSLINILRALSILVKLCTSLPLFIALYDQKGIQGPILPQGAEAPPPPPRDPYGVIHVYDGNWKKAKTVS